MVAAAVVDPGGDRVVRVGRVPVTEPLVLPVVALQPLTGALVAVVALAEITAAREARVS
jgi:hypothetical protein